MVIKFSKVSTLGQVRTLDYRQKRHHKNAIFTSQSILASRDFSRFSIKTLRNTSRLFSRGMSLATLPKPETNEERFALIRSVGEECITESDLRNLIEKKPGIRCYDGFEPSGRMHIAQGIFKSINVNKCTNSGCKFVFWVADWFALMNDKMGGEIERIRVVGKYLVEVWRAAGMDMDNVEFLWSSDEINSRAGEYWRIVLDIARRNTLARIKKCCTIMGKQEGTLTTAQILYPIMQCADIFFIKADICQLGLDQRKCNMLAREYCDQIGRKLKPVILSHHMLAGLKAGQAKMSKSDPESAIFMEDTAEDVERKIMAAHCPRVAQKAKEVQEDGAPTADDETNPCLDYLNCIVFSNPNASFVVGDATFTTSEALESAFISGEVSEEALKKALIGAINGLLEPVRKHFTESEEAKNLLETIKGYKKEPVAPQPPKVVDNSIPRLAVFVPATVKLHLDIALSIVEQVDAFLAANGDAAEAVLYLPDWSATARNEVTGDEKDVAAILAYNAALIGSYGLNPKATIVKQSDAILADPSNYWIEVINAGRQYMTSKVEAYVGDVTCAGVLIAGLMRCVDVATLKATACLTIPEFDLKQNSLACEHMGGSVSEIVLVTPSHRKLCDPAAEATTDDAFLFADDSDMDIRRKLKKAFAAEKDASNPVVGLAGRFVGAQTTLKTQGGELAITSIDELVANYTSGAIHPGDLKPFVSDNVVGLYANVRKTVATPDVKKLATVVKNAEKKLAKKK